MFLLGNAVVSAAECQSGGAEFDSCPWRDFFISTYDSLYTNSFINKWYIMYFANAHVFGSWLAMAVLFQYIFLGV